MHPIWHKPSFQVNPVNMSQSPFHTPSDQVTKAGQPRRSSGSVRKMHLANGAFLVEFKNPAEPLDMFGGRVMPPGLGPCALQHAAVRKAAVDQYRTMERKGFLVTKDTGCLIPDPQYCTTQGGATVKGHQRAFSFFAHWRPTHGSQATRNEFGWPMNLQISHRCHRRSCCRVDHLLAEEHWRNAKRNFCGYSGECDCGNATGADGVKLKCLRRYQSDDVTDQPEYCQTSAEVAAVLMDAPPHVIHSASRFSNRDGVSKQRRLNKAARARKQELHAHATAKNQLKRQKRERPDMAEGSDDDAFV